MVYSSKHKRLIWLGMHESYDIIKGDYTTNLDKTDLKDWIEGLNFSYKKVQFGKI